MSLSYEVTNWENGKTVLKSEHLRKIEKGITDIISENDAIYKDEDTRKSNEKQRQEEHSRKMNEASEVVSNIQKDYDSLQKIIIDENASANLQKQINSVNSQLEQKAEKIYVDTKIGNMGNTKTFKGSCLYSALPTTGAKVDDYWYVTDIATNYCWNGTSWIDIGNNLNIGENTITPEKTNFIKVIESANKLNPKLLTKGFMQNSGVISVAEWALSYSYTAKIKCDKSKKIYFTKSGTPSSQIGCVFNGNIFVSAISNIASITSVQDSEGTFYYKILFNSDAPSFDNIVLNILNESINNKEKLYVIYDLDDSKNDFAISKNYVDYSIENNLENVNVLISEKAKTLDDDYRQAIINEANSNKIDNIVQCWGDSLTRGVGCTNYSTKSYPSVLKSLLGESYAINNLGVGGEGVQQISARQGGSYAYVQPVTIPASGGVAITLKDSSGNAINLIQQSGTSETGNGGINPCYINEIKGTLTNVSGKITFTRETTGEEIILTHQKPLITNAMTNYKNGILIIWAGTNNRPYINNIPTSEKNEIFNVIKRIKNMINYSTSKKYIVIGMTSKAYMSQIVEINKMLSNEFGSNFLDLRTNILTDGLQLAGLTPTSQDTTDIENGEIPISLRVDEVHFNDAGYTLIANYIYEHGKMLGYW